MEKSILLKLPLPFNVVEVERIEGNTNKQTQMLSTIKYFKTKKFSETFIQSQLLIIGYSEDDIQRAINKW